MGLESMWWLYPRSLSKKRWPSSMNLVNPQEELHSGELLRYTNINMRLIHL